MINELRRMAYLDAMGVHSYISRTQLPGAAASRRLVIVRPEAAAGGRTAPAAAREVRRAALRLPEVEETSTPVTPGPTDTAADDSAVQPALELPRFSLAAIIAGDWLWLEELDGLPLATEQVQLVQAMAQALQRVGALVEGRSGQESPGPARPQVIQFDWPMHNNPQLDLGAQAARASVAGFIGRKLEQFHCQGLILLGESCKTRVPLDQLGDTPVTATLGSAAMLADPSLKKQAWRDLFALAARH
jgi:hypothetical protein